VCAHYLFCLTFWLKYAKIKEKLANFTYIL
jgi:hypothetical protein